jgi:Rnl2 family RNA ligase
MPPKKVKLADPHIAISVALSGRTPVDGDIMSLGACIFTPADRTIHGVRQWNLLPQHPRPFQNPEVVGFWSSKPQVIDLLMRDREEPGHVFKELVSWAASFGKLTLVGLPLMTSYGFLAQALQRYVPGAAVPWGFSGVCAKSYCSGVAGVASKDINKSDLYESWHESFDFNQLPGNDAAVVAVIYINAANHHGASPAAATTNGSNDDAAAAAPKKPVAGAIWACEKPPITTPVPPLPAVVADEAPFRFLEYPKIVDVDFEDAPKLANSVVNREVAEGQWVATEKVHGSNMGIWTDGSVIRASKRSGFLKKADGAAFFGFDRLVAAIKDAVLAVHGDTVKRAMELTAPEEIEVESVVVFGEIAGGEYVHESVAPDIRGRRVQAGVQYSPTNFFYAFDVAFVRKGSDKLEFLPLDVARGVVERDSEDTPASQLLWARPLLLGNMAAALAHEEEFQSTIPARLGLPKLAAPNFAEGLVIRPLRDVTLPDGRRLIFKNKHPMFREFQSQGASTLAAHELIFALVNEARVAAVASKHLQTEVASDAQLRALVIDDVMEDARRLLEKRGDPHNAHLPSIRDAYAEALAQSVQTAISAFRAR